MASTTSSPPVIAADAARTAAMRRRLAVVLWAVTVVLCVLSALVVLLVRRGWVMQMFSVGAEANVPTWWSNALLLSSALVALVIGAAAGPSSRPRPRTWFVVAAVLAAMALDEVASMHERLGLLGDWAAARTGIEQVTYSWLVPGIAVLAVLAVVGWRWWRDLPRDVAQRVVVAAAVMLSGAIVMEALAGLMRGMDRTGLMYGFTAVEELLEMAGMVLLLLALLRLLVVVRLPGGSHTIRLRQDVSGES